MAERQGVVVMAYGTPRGLADVEAYYTDIRHGRPPPPDLLADLQRRYRAIGGRSPLLEITQAQAAGIEARLEGVRAYLGQKHARPTIPDAVERLATDGVDRAVGLVLAPHYSAMSVGDYERRLRAAARDARWTGTLTMIRGWHVEPGYVELLARRVKDACESLPPGARTATTVLFTAHSLPASILNAGDPYPDQLRATAREVARVSGIDRWDTAWQSAGRTEVPWLEPDVLSVMRDLAAGGERGVVVCPCGFVADHLEILYDVDVECAGLAAELGLAFARTASPNADPHFLDTLAGIVRRALRG